MGWLKNLIIFFYLILIYDPYFMIVKLNYLREASIYSEKSYGFALSASVVIYIVIGKIIN